MNELQMEQETLHFGTAKRKADLMEKTGISPQKISAAIKRFGQPVPRTLVDAQEYTSELFDFVLDEDPFYYSAFPEAALISDLNAYVMGEVWQVKLKTRTIQDQRCLIAMDMRKLFKDFTAGIAQIAGHIVKTSGKDLPAPTKDQLRIMFVEAAEESAEQAFGKPLKDIALLQ